MQRPISNVAMEAVVIGIMNVGIIYALKFGLNIDNFIIYLLAGALIHILFEYSGGNQWWCTQTYKL